MSPRSRRRRWLLYAVPVVLVGLVVALVLFEPWKLVVDDVVDEALPTVTSTAPTTPATAPATGTPAPASPTADGATVLAEGTLVSHEHETSGTVRVLRLGDGSRVLRLEDLDTSNGPDLKVWVTDAPVIEGRDGWFVFDDGEYVDLGDLRGNRGSQNYPLPAEVDLAELSSVSIWCARFRVSFGAAELTPVGA